MPENSKIEWCDHTWSPWRGCTKVSPGCANCYAEALSKRNPAVLGQWGKGSPRVLAKNWGDPIKWDEAKVCTNCGNSNRLDALVCGAISCAHFEFRRPRVFPSLCDWLDEDVPIEWLVRFLQLIHDTPNIDWLLLTKRPQNWYQRMFDALLHAEGISDPNLSEQDPETEVGGLLNDWLRPVRLYSPKNVWVGTSVEDQLSFFERVPDLLRTSARRRFLSVEPLLGPVDIEMALEDFHPLNPDLSRKPAPIDWVIVGGESGPRSRPCNVEWIRSIVSQCKQAGVPCFVKQLGTNPIDRNDRGFDGDSGPSGWPMGTDTVDDIQPGVFQGKPVGILLDHPKGGHPAEWPEDLRVRQFPEVVK